VSVHLPLFVMIPVLAACVWAVAVGVRSLRDAVKLMEAERLERAGSLEQVKLTGRARDANGLA
jgi:hypothetical protein